MDCSWNETILPAWLMQTLKAFVSSEFDMIKERLKYEINDGIKNAQAGQHEQKAEGENQGNEQVGKSPTCQRFEFVDGLHYSKISDETQAQMVRNREPQKQTT